MPDVLDSAKNTAGMKYFIPEVRMMLQECIDRQTTCDPSAYECFIKKQQLEATKIMNVSIVRNFSFYFPYMILSSTVWP